MNLKSLHGVSQLNSVYFCFEKDSLYRDPNEFTFDMKTNKFYRRHLPCPSHAGGKPFEVSPKHVIHVLKGIRDDTWAYDCYGYEEVIDKYIEVAEEIIFDYPTLASVFPSDDNRRSRCSG